jgi:hypothetical protein
VCGVLVGFSPTGCTSIQIVMTLGYEYRLFVTIFRYLTNGIMFINVLMTLLYFYYLSDNSCLT